MSTRDASDTIVGVEAIRLSLPTIDVGRNDPSQEVVILRMATESGRVGLAECNHSAASVVAAVQAAGASSIGAGITQIISGRTPGEREKILGELYEQNILSFRRGLGLAVLHALDVCLWDLLAQQREQPLWQMVWGEQAAPPRPYLTLYTGPGEYEASIKELGRLIDVGMPLGYQAAKLEPLPDCVPEDRISDFVATGRRLLGPEVELFVDFGHRFRDADTARRHIEQVAEHGVALIETPMLADDVWEYARLAETSPVPLAASELYESVWEYRALLDVGRIAVVQPWPNRVGITETLEVSRRALDAGRRCILAGWNTTPIGVATGVHVAAGLGTGITLEHAPDEAYGSPLGQVAAPAPRVHAGVIALPTGPGLGVELDPEVVERYRV